MGHDRIFCVALLSSFPVSSDNHAPQERRRWTQMSQLLSEVSSFSYLGWNIYYAKGSTLVRSNNPPIPPFEMFGGVVAFIFVCVCCICVWYMCIWDMCVSVYIYSWCYMYTYVYMSGGNPRSVFSLFLRKCSACVFESSLPFITNSYIYHGYHGFIYLVRSESQGSTCFPFLSPDITRTRTSP